MLQHLTELVWPAALQRLVLALNHVLASETEAVARLRPHVGRIIRLSVEGLPALLQWPGILAFRITPAGLLELAEPADAEQADLAMRVDAGQPAVLMQALLDGRRPPVAIDGDAHLAADVAWLMDHVRWDYADDLDRVFGPLVGGQLARLFAAAAAAARQVLRTLAQFAPGGGEPPVPTTTARGA
ncbi:MAG: hypothetical protein AB1666_03960 [Pseudomonadota bacterium]